MEMPSDPNANTRVRIAFLLLFVFTIASSVGVYFLANLGRQQESIAARESQAALHGVTNAKQIDKALRQHPSKKSLQLIANPTNTPNQTSASTDKLPNE